MGLLLSDLRERDVESVQYEVFNLEQPQLDSGPLARSDSPCCPDFSQFYSGLGDGPRLVLLPGHCLRS